MGLPLRVMHLEVPPRDIEWRLAGDVTSGRRDDLRAATASIAAAVVARDVLTFLGWLQAS